MLPSRLMPSKSSIKKNTNVNLQHKQSIKKVDSRSVLNNLERKNLYDSLYNEHRYSAKSLNDKLGHHESSAKSQKALNDINKTNDLVSRINSTRRSRL